MKNKFLLIVFVGLFVVSFVVGVNVFSSSRVGSYDVSGFVSCVNVSSFFDEHVYGNCSYTRVNRVCSDAPANLSCSDVTETFIAGCITGSRSVEHVRRECKQLGYYVNDVRLNTENYKCSFNQEGRKMIAICDSVLDGNGDGICQSGESCQKFVINGHSVLKFEKNSLNDFVEQDDFFEVNKASAEVLQ